MHQIPKLLSPLLVVILSLGQLEGQTPVMPPFQEDFEADTLNSAWQANPNKGIVAIRHDTSIANVSKSGNQAMALGNHKDTAQLKKSLDLHLDLSSSNQVELSFWIKSNADNQNPEEGLWLSDDGGNNFVKAKNFNTSQWCNDYAFHPVIDLDSLASANQLSLTSNFVVRFVQKDNNDFYLPGRDGYFIDDVAVKAPDAPVSLPFTDGFEGSGSLKQGWTISAAFNTQAPDTAAVFPAGIVQKTSNSTIAGVAQTGNRGLVMGKLCNGRDHVNALDLNLDLSSASGVNLDFAIKSNGDEYHPQDGIYFSDDGGNNFVKVVDLDLPQQCNEYLNHPTLDVDALAAYHGLSLTDHFVIRFQQYDNQSIFNSDGLFFDNIAVTSDNQNYATLPYNEDFENGLGQEWRSTRLDSQNVQHPVTPLVSGFAGIKDTSSINGIAYQGSKALGLGKSCGTSSNISSMDLHLDLSNAQQPVLSFWFRNYGDENHPKDGIWMSDNGGDDFTKTVDFKPKNWCGEYGQHPPINIQEIAQEHGLALTSNFVVRFQQQDNYAFNGTFNDGYFMDEVEVKEQPANYVSLPFQDGFEGAPTLGNGWQLGNATKTSMGDSSSIGPHGLVRVQDTNAISEVAANGTNGLVLGKRCDGGKATNALDLQLDLSNTTRPLLNFSVKSNNDQSDPQDGIWMSDDGGATFHKVMNFDPDQWCQGYQKYPDVDIQYLAQQNGLALTSNFIVRFQQQSSDGVTGNNQAGIFIDDLSVIDGTSFVSLPFTDDFESNTLQTGWQVRAPYNSGGVDTTNIYPTGLVQVVDTSQLSGVAQTGQGGLVMSQACSGQDQLNALDLNLDLSNASQVNLDFWLKRLSSSADSLEGIYFSDDGGSNFTEVLNLEFEQQCNAYLKHPTIDIDALAGKHGLSLSSNFVIRFQQYGSQGLSNNEGFFLDNISVTSANKSYASLPYNENFENGLGQEWGGVYIDSQNVNDAIKPGLSSFAGIIDTIDLSGAAYEGAKTLGFGKTCGSNPRISFRDLHLDLGNAQNPVLNFRAKNLGDETHPNDGIWMSDDGGKSFEKVVDFKPQDWCSGYGQFQNLDIAQLAQNNGLSLTSNLVLRFQQQDNLPFTGTNKDGFFIDDLSIEASTTNYASVPFNEDFESSDQLGIHWQISNPSDSIGPQGLVQVIDTNQLSDAAASGKNAVLLSKQCDGNAVSNALDLRLDLSAATQPMLSFHIKGLQEATDPQDGIWMSDDGGASFQKVINFDPDEWCNDYQAYPALNLAQVAQENGLSLTSTFVIRFQQQGSFGINGANQNGLLIDDVSIVASKSFVQVPFYDSFETNGPLKIGWQQAPATNAMGVHSSNLSPNSAATVMDTTTLPGVAQSGKGGLVMGSNCDNQEQVNALDLNLDLSNQDDVDLHYWIQVNDNSKDTLDGIYFSDDGGSSFKKVWDFQISTQCNDYFRQPALDVDELAATNGLSLSDEFIIRFQQKSNQSIANQGGLMLDNVAVTTKGDRYAALPVQEDFEDGLDSAWTGTKVDSHTVYDTLAPIPTSFSGIKDTSSIAGVAKSGAQALALGKSCGTEASLSMVDLNLDLSNAQAPGLSFWFKNNGDENHPRDGIWMSDDGGQTFTKVINFAPKDWCNTYGFFPQIPLKQVASEHGLSLTSEFIIRFQQTSNYPFAGIYDDGYFIDDVHVKEKGSQYMDLPFADDFEDSLQLGKGWKIGYGEKTQLNDSNTIGPHGSVKIMDTNQISGIAASGKQAVGLGKLCEGGFATNALDLQLDLSSANQPELDFSIKSNDEEAHPQDGIWFSDDGGSTFQKVWDFNPSDWCQGYGNYPALPLAKMAERHNMDLTDQFIVRFQQYDNYFFTGEFKDGLFIDDVSVQEQQTSWANIPYQEDFEGSQGLSGIWTEGNAAYTSDTGSFPVKPGSQVKKVDTSFVPNAAFSGQQSLALGKTCDGSLTTNSADLRILKGNCDNIRLQFYLKSNTDEVQSGDGIWLSNDQGQSFTKIYNYNYQLAEQFYEQFAFNLDTAAQSAGLSLTDSLILRFQQQDDNDFFRDGRDGIFIDDVKLECTFPTVREEVNQLQFNVYPNPVQDELVVEMPNIQHEDQLILTVKNALGQVVQQLEVDSSKNLKRIDAKAMDSGVYFLTIQGAQSKNTVRFVKE